MLWLPADSPRRLAQGAHGARVAAVRRRTGTPCRSSAG